MTDEMIHAQMAALYAQQRQDHKPADHLDILLPLDLCEAVRHYAAARDCTAKQALALIISKFFGPCFKSPQSATSPLTLRSAK